MSSETLAPRRSPLPTGAINTVPERCPVQSALAVISGKWKPLIMYHLMERPMRFGELTHAIPRISHRMLARQLHELESTHLVVRHADPGSRRGGVYQLTDLARDLDAVFSAIAAWGTRYLDAQDADTEREARHG